MGPLITEVHVGSQLEAVAVHGERKHPELDIHDYLVAKWRDEGIPDKPFDRGNKEFENHSNH